MSFHNKIIIGSLINELEKAKKTGKLCILDLYILDIIDSLIPSCNRNDSEKLKKLYRDLKNKSSIICNIKPRVVNSTLK